MKMFKNLLWMVSGVGVGLAASMYSKDIKRLFKKGKKEMSKTIKNIESN